MNSGVKLHYEGVGVARQKRLLLLLVLLKRNLSKRLVRGLGFRLCCIRVKLHMETCLVRPAFGTEYL